MSVQNTPHHLDRTARDLAPDEGGLRAPSHLGTLGKAWWWFHFVILVKLARLRFLVVLAAIGFVIARWDWLNTHYEKLTRPLLGQEATTSADTEYWCPMHPSVIRDHPDKCPVCNMGLAKRKKQDRSKGDELPPGITSRVQLTPYKVAVAGIETAEVAYRPLTREISAVGLVEFDERKLARISVRATGKSRIDKLYVNVTGQTVHKGDPLAEVYSPDLVVTVQNLLDAHRAGNEELVRMARDRLLLWGIDRTQIDSMLRTGKTITHVTLRAPISGHVIRKYQVEGEYVEEGAQLFYIADLSIVWIEAQVYEDEVAFLKEGLTVVATTKSFPNRAFEGKLSFIHPHLDAATRTLRVRFDMPNPHHTLRPGMWATVELRVPVTQMEQLPSDADVARKEAYVQGQVLAVPERAVIDTGSRKIVYRETNLDEFEGVEVALGPRCGDAYPVIHGLRAGDRVATTGSFLIDAETRLGAGVASTYFGASGGPQSDHRSTTTAARPSMQHDEESRFQAVLSKLSPADRAVAAAQGYCPVLRTRLGSMGMPVAVTLRGQKVFLCCSNCIEKARAAAAGTLDAVAKLKAGAGKAPAPPAANTVEAKIKAGLDKLDAADRRLAVEQRFCPVRSDVRLGQMGKPAAIMLKGRKVFLCCGGCADDARKNPDKTLAEVDRLKARASRSK